MSSVPRSDPAIDESDFDIVHFPFQRGFLTELPSIYHPHDLQHLHLPHFFTPEQRRDREIVYRTLCEDASMVAVASNWVREDILSSYQIPEDRVVVVPLAPPVDAYGRPSQEELAVVRKRYGLPSQFILYPATTWPHKNHIRLLQALATLRANGLDVSLVCTGTQTEHFRSIRLNIHDLDLNDSIRFLGSVPAEELMALYEMARAVVVPTEFEAASFPIWEAFRAGVPVACSNVTSLPEQVGEAAILFDPRDISAMAAALWEVWSDTNRREDLVARGRKQVEQYDWVKTARIFRAHYRRIAGRVLDEEDLHIVSAVSSI